MAAAVWVMAPALQQGQCRGGHEGCQSAAEQQLHSPGQEEHRGPTSAFTASLLLPGSGSGCCPGNSHQGAEEFGERMTHMCTGMTTGPQGKRHLVLQGQDGPRQGQQVQVPGA